MPDRKSPANFPVVTGLLRTFMTDGRDIAIELPTDAGAVQFRVDLGQIGMIVARLFEAAIEAQRHRVEDRSLDNIINDIQPIIAAFNPQIRVTNTTGLAGFGMIGIVQEIGGVPFNGALSPDTALNLAEQLRAAVRGQAAAS